MPKIEVNEEVLYTMVGKRWDTSDLASKNDFVKILECAKAELDEDSNKKLPPEERTFKIDFNDTNRPDLWGTAGFARQLRSYCGVKAAGLPRADYSFFSRPGSQQKTRHKVVVEKSVAAVRPFIVSFIARGRTITDPLLIDMIQTQEKLAGNYGRKRKHISMGLYRTENINWPVVYKGVDPDKVSFVPLHWEGSLTLREILKQHPKGKEFAFILEHEKIHPFLTDSKGEVLSYPPIINSAGLGAVQVGDSEILVELTGSDQKTVTHAGSIMACDLADNGFTIEPVEVEYEFDTPFGRNYVTPYYFQEPVFCSLARVEKFLGKKLSGDECVAALAKMGVKAEKAVDAEKGECVCAGIRGEGVTAWPPEYRNDFLHAADVAEDVMIGRGMDFFEPERPKAFTIGRLKPLTIFSRKVRDLVTGLGYQEMIYNYLGSRKDFVEKMRRDDGNIVRISNPMTENYEYVRDGIISSLLISESVSAHAVYPHRIFEIGRITYKDDSNNFGTVTRQYLGFLRAEKMSILTPFRRKSRRSFITSEGNIR